VWRAIGPYLPHGAGLDAVRNIGYFGVGRPRLVDLGAPRVLGRWVGAVAGRDLVAVERERRHPGSGSHTAGATA